KILTYIFLSILFTLPFLIINGLLYAPIHFAPEFSREVGVSMSIYLLLLISGAYSFFCPFVCFFKMRKEGAKSAWEQHIKTPLVQFYPILLTVGLLLWMYFWALNVPLKQFTFSPPMEFIHLFAFLLFVAEGFKITERSYLLGKYKGLSKEESYPLQLSPSMLDFLVYAQSPIYLFFFWGSNLLGMYMADRLFSNSVSYNTMMFIYVFVLLIMTFSVRWAGRKIESYGKIHAYIPWLSKY
ncbi:MAG: hypothetical protein AAFR87_20870, partial [Bacteroidota bacterium]